MENKKSKRLLAIAKWIFVIGFIACAAGAIGYLVMHELGYQIKFIGAFQVEHLLYVAGLFLVFCLFALIFLIAGRIARSHESAPEAEAVNDYTEQEDEKIEQTCCKEEVAEAEGDAATSVEVEVVADENAEDAEKVSDKKAHFVTMLKNKSIDPETKEKVIATAKKVAPVVVAVAATATVSAVLCKMSNEKKKAKIRRSLLDLLY